MKQKNHRLNETKKVNQKNLKQKQTNKTNLDHLCRE